MEKVKETLTGFFIALGVYAIIIGVVGIFFSEDILSYMLGLVAGVACAVILIMHMMKTLDTALDLPEEQASKYIRRQSLFRLFAMLFGMIVAINIEKMYFVTFVLGLLGLKIGALTAPFFLRRLYPDSFITKETEEITE